MDLKQGQKPPVEFLRAALAVCAILSKCYANEQRKMVAVRKSFSESLILPYREFRLVVSLLETDESVVDASILWLLLSA